MLATPDLILESNLPHRLGELLPRWVREVPLYSGIRHALNGQGAIHASDLAGWPFITKQDIRRQFPRNFLRPNQDLDSLLEQEVVELEHTSGTSQERTPLILPKGWWGEQEDRALRLNSFVAEVLDSHPNARRVSLVSPMCNNDICYTGVPSPAERVVENALFLSLSRFPFLWTGADLARMASETLNWRPVFLDVDPVYGVAFARYCERNRIRFPSLRFVVCSYEFVSAVHRRLLERVFGVPVFDLYGSTETGHLLMESTGGLMRPSLETAALDLIEPDPRGVGELVVTTLTNDYMPLIRYRIGDLARRVETPLGTRYVVHGRVADAVRTRAGRVTLRDLDECIARSPGIAHYQLHRKDAERFVLRFIPDSEPPDDSQVRELETRLGELLQARVVAEAADLLMPERSGKFRLCYPDAAVQM